MPIYAYQCSACGHAEDVLQRLSDAPLSSCPACGQATYVKQVTAAGFQLKGSGWYVTDFRDQGSKAKPGSTPSAADAAPSVPASESAASSSASSAPTTPASATPAAPVA